MSNDGSINLGDLNGSGTPFTLSSVEDNGAIINGASFLNELALDAATAGVALPLFDVSASGFIGGTITGDLTLPLLALDAGTADAALPAFTVAATATNGALVTGLVTLPQLDASGSLEPPLPLPSPILNAVMVSGSVASGAVTLSNFLLAADAGPQGDSTLPQLAVSADGVSGALGLGNASYGFSVAAGAIQSGLGTGEVTLGVLSLSGSLQSANLIDAVVTLPLLDASASGVTAQPASADLTVPLYAVDGAMGFSVIGEATLTIPAFAIAGSADAPASGQASATPNTATVISLNTIIKAVTLYSNLNANSFAVVNGVVLAATPDGIVALTGDTDLGSQINATILSGISDMGGDMFKQVLSAFVGYRAGGEMELSLITDEHTEFNYLLEPRQADELHGSRVKFGRGIKGRYWQWRLENRDGADFDMASVEFHIQPLNRSV